jgi:putative transposase
VIYQCRQEYTIKAMCAFFAVSRAAYYGWVRQLSRADPDEDRMRLVQEAYATSHQTYGYRRIQIWLQRQRGVGLNHKTVLRLMRKIGIRSIARRRKAYWSGAGVKIHHHYPNLLQRDFEATQPNQKWVTDVTYIRTQQGWAYLSTIKDLYDGFIVAHQVSAQNSGALVHRTLAQARQNVKHTAGVILHSDQGPHYCSHDYHRQTRELRVQPSMSRRGNCWDNAPMENFFSHLKEEALRHCKNPTFEQVREVIEEYIRFYNYERIQLKTKLTPYERRCQSI